MSPVTIVLEAAVGLLLAACVFYCWRLDRKLSALRTGQDGIREAARELNASVAAAEAAIKNLRSTAHEAGRDLQARIDTAGAIAEKLGVALGRVRSVADIARGNR